MKKRVLVCFGTRPEVIKLAPVVFALRKRPQDFECLVCSTGQHREMVDQALEPFDLKADIQLDAMSRAGSLGRLSAALFEDLDRTLESVNPHTVIVQGDTTSAFVGAMTAYYRRLEIAHVEAGLRTHDIYSPFPEEINRVFISKIAHFNFAPTPLSAHNLQHENVDSTRIFVTGNTVVDAVHYLRDRVTSGQSLSVNPALTNLTTQNPKFILVTSHRRENFGAGLSGICDSLLEIVRQAPDIAIVFPVHLNPQVRQLVHGRLGNHPRIILTEPVDYLSMLYLMQRAYCILSDSGGIQEEAPSLQKPLLILRENTERPECVEAGCAMLVGTEASKIVDNTLRLLRDSNHYKAMSEVENPFGDGLASEKIAEILKSTT